MEELFKLAANYGFPIVISGYLLIRMESKMESLAESIRALTNAIRDDFSDMPKEAHS